MFDRQRTEQLLAKAKWLAAEAHRTGKPPVEIAFYHGGTEHEIRCANGMITGEIRNDGEALEFLAEPLCDHCGHRVDESGRCTAPLSAAD